MKDDHFVSRILTIAGALMCISGLLMAICVKILYGGILYQNGTFPTLDLRAAVEELTQYAIPTLFQESK